MNLTNFDFSWELDKIVGGSCCRSSGDVAFPPGSKSALVTENNLHMIFKILAFPRENLQIGSSWGGLLLCESAARKKKKIKNRKNAIRGTVYSLLIFVWLVF